MQELIKIEKREIGLELVNSVNSRELHVTLEAKRDYSNWMKQQIGTLGLEENVDFILLALKGEQKNGSGGHNTKDYIITTDTAKHIAMASRTPKGKEVRRYFIEVEKRANYTEGRLDERVRGLELVMEQMTKSILTLSQGFGMLVQAPRVQGGHTFVTLNPSLRDNKRRKEEFIRTVIDVLDGFEDGISQSALFHRLEFSQSEHTRRWLHEGVGVYWDMYMIPGNGYRYIAKPNMAEMNH